MDKHNHPSSWQMLLSTQELFGHPCHARSSLAPPFPAVRVHTGHPFLNVLSMAFAQVSGTPDACIATLIEGEGTPCSHLAHHAGISHASQAHISFLPSCSMVTILTCNGHLRT